MGRGHLGPRTSATSQSTLAKRTDTAAPPYELAVLMPKKTYVCWPGERCDPGKYQEFAGGRPCTKELAGARKDFGTTKYEIPRSPLDLGFKIRDHKTSIWGIETGPFVQKA